MQEGLAVAFGGRGGLTVNTILETGIFIIESGFADYTELLNRNNFLNTDASISYPVSGLYTDFLIKQIGVDGFIGLYKKYSASNNLSKIDVIDKSLMPSDEKWKSFVNSLSNSNPIKLAENIDLNNFEPIIKNDSFEIYSNDEEYFFRIKENLLISVKDKIPDYQSKLFSEHFPDRKYQSEKYLITANQNEVSLYNLYSNNLIGKYVASFSIPPKLVTKQNDYYKFSIRKDLFDEDL